MSGCGEVVCEGWLRKSPPEKKLRRHAWKRRWFVLRCGKMTGDPDVLQYYKHHQAKKPIKTINLDLCEQVDAGLSFTKQDVACSFVFDLKTEDRVWYLVADSQEDMDRWVSSICQLCGFNPTDQSNERPPDSTPSSVTTTTTSGHAPSSTVTVMASIPPPYDPVCVRHLEVNRNIEEDYLWLDQCQSHRPPHVSSDDTNSSSSSSPSPLPNGGVAPPPPSCCSGTAPWAVAAATNLRGQLLDSAKCDLGGKGGGGGAPAHGARTHSDAHAYANARTGSGCDQVPRSGCSAPLAVPSDTGPVSQVPPPRPPKPTAKAKGETSDALPRSQSERRSGGGGGGGGGGGERERDETGGGESLKVVSTSLCSGGECYSIPKSLSDRSNLFEFSDGFNKYFVNKGLHLLGNACSEDADADADENYVPMSAATTEPPLRTNTRSAPPPPPATIITTPLPAHDPAYVPMTPLPPPPSDLASLGRQVPPPAHLGFRPSPLGPLLTPPTRRRPPVGGEVPAAPPPAAPPVHRNLKPQRKAKPLPLDITPSQAWEEVPPPVRSPVTRTFTRDPSSRPSVKGGSAHSSSPSSDSDDPDDSYVAMTTTPTLHHSAGESCLRLMSHRSSEGGASSPALRRAREGKQVEYLDLDLHTGRSTPTRMNRCTAEGVGATSGGVCEERARGGGRGRVDYALVDPERTQALRNTREAWHDGRVSAEKDK